MLNVQQPFQWLFCERTPSDCSAFQAGCQSLIHIFLLSVQFNSNAPAPIDTRPSLSILSDELSSSCPAAAEIVRIQRVSNTPDLLEVLIRTQSCYVGQVVLEYAAACSVGSSAVEKVQSAAEVRGVTSLA